MKKIYHFMQKEIFRDAHLKFIVNIDFMQITISPNCMLIIKHCLYANIAMKGYTEIYIKLFLCFSLRNMRFVNLNSKECSSK